MKYKIIAAFLLFFLINPVEVKAYCYGADIIRERVRAVNIASNLNFSSFYTENNGEVYFSVRIANLNKDIYTVEKLKSLIVNYGSSKENPTELIVSGYRPGDRLQFEIYAKNTECINDVMIHTRYVTLPYYNKYYKDAMCSGIEDYYLCKKWANVNLNYDDFKKNITDYKKTLEQEVIEPEKEDESKFLIFILDMIEKYHRPVLGTIIIVGVALIIRESRKNDFGF